MENQETKISNVTTSMKVEKEMITLYLYYQGKYYVQISIRQICCMI